MPSKQRVIMQLPLAELRDDQAPLTRQRDVGKEQIAELLRQGPVRFVVADCGHPLRWIAIEDRFRFWKDKVQPYLVEPDAAEIHLEDFPDEYCFRASEWAGGGSGPVVLLERLH